MDLSNTVGLEPWICVPHMATDDTVRFSFVFDNHRHDSCLYGFTALCTYFHARESLFFLQDCQENKKIPFLDGTHTNNLLSNDDFFTNNDVFCYASYFMFACLYNLLSHDDFCTNNDVFCYASYFMFACLYNLLSHDDFCTNKDVFCYASYFIFACLYNLLSHDDFFTNKDVFCYASYFMFACLFRSGGWHRRLHSARMVKNH